MAKVKIDASRAFQKLRKLTQLVDRASQKSIEQIVEIGKLAAKQYVPKDTQQTYEAIQGKTYKYGGGWKGKVYVEMHTRTESSLTTTDVAYLIANPGKKRNGHIIPPDHIQTGSTRFMAISRDWMNRRKAGIAQGNFRTIQLR